MRDPIPDSVEFYHISEDASDLGYDDAPRLGIFGNARATLQALADELQAKVPEATVKRNIEHAQQQKDALWRQLMDETGAAIREDGKIAPIVAAHETLRPLPDGFLLVDEALCANAFTQRMHRSTGGRQYFHDRGGGLGWGCRRRSEPPWRTIMRRSSALLATVPPCTRHKLEIPVTGIGQIQRWKGPPGAKYSLARGRSFAGALHQHHPLLRC
jgi:hypothetical protein